MNIISLEFIIFIIVTLITYYIIPQRYRWIILLGASIFFYSYTGKGSTLTLLCVSLFAYIMARFIETSSAKTKKRKWLFSIAVIILISWFSIIKITNTTGWDFCFIVAPLGISYVSFSLIGYLADIYWEKDSADKNIFQFILYVFFFPKILQGPITRHSNLSPQLYSGGTLIYKNLCFGCQRMIYGYLKKIVIADRIALFTDTVFKDVSIYSGSIIIASTIMASLQLYCDFSGYMDIVLGFTEMLGLEMEENFKCPFFSKTAAEFWRRWHITLGGWFKDYVYTPIVMSHIVKKAGKYGRKKIGKRFGNSLMKVIALGTVWLLTGLWHGTGINYILWGIYWGIIIIFSVVFENEITIITKKVLHINTKAISWKWFQMLRTFILFSFGVMITRLESIYDFKILVYNFIYNFNLWAYFDGTLFQLGLDKINFNIVCGSLILVWIISCQHEKNGKVREQIAGLNAPIRWFIYAFSITIVIFLGIYGTGYNTSGFAYTYF